MRLIFALMSIGFSWFVTFQATGGTGVSGLDGTVRGPLVVMNGRMETVASCQVASDDPGGVFDCKIEAGHDLTEIVRITIRGQQQERVQCRIDKQNLLTGWKKTIRIAEEAIKALHAAGNPSHTTPSWKKDAA